MEVFSFFSSFDSISESLFSVERSFEKSINLAKRCKEEDKIKFFCNKHKDVSNN